MEWMQKFYEKASKGIGSSNLSMESEESPGMLRRVVNGWFEDNGNEEHLVHRRWALNPSMKYTGFGQVDSFQSMYSFDESRKTPFNYKAVCYPAEPAFSSDFFGGSYVWSVSLNPKLYNTPDQKLVQVTLTQIQTKKEWRFGSGSGEFFRINTVNFGIPNVIIWGPSDIISYSGTYHVKISGIKEKENGKAATLDYDVTFFSLEAPGELYDFHTVITNSVTITKFVG